MNLPSSLALSQSKFFQSRLGILLIALVGLAIAAGIMLLRRQEPSAPTLPTPASSPAAQSLTRPVPKPVTYGPPTPLWARTDIQYGPMAPPEFLASAAPAAGTSAATSAPTILAPDEATAPVPMAEQAPGSAMSTIPGSTVSTVPGSAVSTVPGSAVSTMPGSTVSTVPGSAVSTMPGSTVSTVPGSAVSTIPGSAAAVAGAPADLAVGSVLSGETPKSVDASVLFAREHYEYIGGGRRDPFQSLLDGKFLTQTGDGSLVDVGDIHLVGIMWGSSDKFALVQDSRGHGYVLRVGDPVLNGYISGISKSELQVVQNAFGESQTLSIRLQTKEGDKNATRN